MKDIYKPGDRKSITYVVKDIDVASFEGEVVHPVCSTFALAREIEWTTRQFVLDMRDADEEGIGTVLTIDHVSPAFVGEKLIIEATVETMHGHELICLYIARVGDRLVAKGMTGQKILKRKRLAEILRKP